MVQLRRMFLLSSSAVLGTYSFPPPFLRPLFGMNSLTHSPLTAAISLKHRGGGHVRVMVYQLSQRSRVKDYILSIEEEYRQNRWKRSSLLFGGRNRFNFLPH